MAKEEILFAETGSWEAARLPPDIDGLSFKTTKKKFHEFTDDCSVVTILSVFIYSKLDKNNLDRLPHLKFIATRSVGFDHIDLEECRKRRIVVSNVPHYGESTVAEHAFALLLSLSRKIPESLERTRRGQFDFTALRGFDLSGKTLGIIGTGRIGMHVAKIAKGFGMMVLGFDARPDRAAAERIGFLYVPLHQLLKSSDIITLHLRLDNTTHHFLGREEFGKMKKGVVLINTARGALIDTEALLEALDNGTVKAAGLDVLEEEGLLKEEHELLSGETPRKRLQTALENTVLLKKPNVIVTPHNAFNSDEAVRRILETTLENIKAFVGGHPQNVVQP